MSGTALDNVWIDEVMATDVLIRWQEEAQIYDHVRPRHRI